MKSMKWFRSAALLVVVLAVLSAYSTTNPVTASSLQATMAATSTVGTVAPAMIAKGKVIKIGWGGDQSLQLVKPSSGVLHGAQIAVNRLNAAGGIKGFQVQLVPLDDQCTGDVAATVAQKFASDPDVVGVVGHICSGATVPASDVYEKARIVLVSASATANKVTARGLDVVNRVAFNDDNQGLGDALYFVNELKVSKIAILDDGQSYGKGLADALNREFTKRGGTVTDAESVDKDVKDYRPVLTKLLANPPDLIFFGGYEGPAALITSQAKEVGLKSIFFSDDGAKTSTYIKLAGQDGEGQYASAVSTPAGDKATLDAFVAEYEKTFNVKFTDEDPYQPNGYDAANMIMDGISAVATVDANGNLMIDREALIKAVRATKNFKGLTGTLTCDSKGECGAGAIGIYQIKSGAFVNIKTYSSDDLAAASAPAMAATMAATAAK